MAVIPTVVNDSTFDPPPNDFEDVVRNRLYFDPDPVSGVDKSLRSYIFAASYGRFWSLM
jgi:hypothetical protein